METLEKLNEAVSKVINIANTINDEVSDEVCNKAPFVIHQRFCSELVRIAKESPKKVIGDIPKFKKVSAALELLEELYPVLTNNKILK